LTRSILDQNNKFTIGPYISCKTDLFSLKIQYRWTDEKQDKIYLDMFSFHFDNNEQCLNFTNDLKQKGFSENKNNNFSTRVVFIKKISEKQLMMIERCDSDLVQIIDYSKMEKNEKE